MLYGNVPQFGGKLLKTIEKEFSTAKNVRVASGYVSLDIVNKFQSDFLKISDKGGISQLLVGMAFYEGLTSKKLEALKNLDYDLRAKKDTNGVYVCYSNKFHGKIYSFGKAKGESIYMGSSNFSNTGLSGNIECTAQLENELLKQQTLDFLDFLFDGDNAVSIDKADITVPGTTKYKERIKLDTLDDLARYDTDTIDKNRYKFFEFPLSRVVTKEKSNLNVYFGKGRLTRSTGKIVPRPWYEVELIADRSINAQPLYPKGDFLAYTDDGFIIPMKTSGDYYKNIRSRGGLKIFGQWIKGKLQKSGALIPLTPVTQDTLDAYGNDSLRFYKIDEGKYYIEF